MKSRPDLYDLDEMTQQKVEIAALKAVPIFNFFGFTWGGNKQSSIPTFNQIQDTIVDLLGGLEEGEEGTIGTGRLVVARRKTEEKKMETTIYLELEEWEE